MKTREIIIPGSKSFTNRALIMATLAKGVSTLHNVSKSDDSSVLIQALKQLGVKIIENSYDLKIVGNSGIFKPINCQINVGEAGTAMRFLTSLISLVPGQITLTGSKRLMERPITELKEAMLKIKSGKVLIKGSISSQFISSLLMIAPVLEKGLEIIITGKLVSRSYIEMTIDLMKKFGVKVKNNQYKSFLVKNQKIIPTDYLVGGDASGASYFWSMAAITGRLIKVRNINPSSVQGDVKFPDILAKMGCQVIKNTKENWIAVKGPKRLKAVIIDMSLMPDTAQSLAVAAAFARGITKITGLSTLRIKETDRLKALQTELAKMGIETKIDKDSIVIKGGEPKGAVIQTYNDHRMAMAFAVAGTKIPGVKINNPEVVTKSFPEFWEKLKNL